MKKFKALILGSIMVFSLAMLTACGEVPEPTEDDVMDALVDEDLITKEFKKEGDYELKIDKIKINDDQDRATVDCTLTVQNGPISTSTEYEVKFKIRDDKESWKTKSAEVGEVKTELTKEITDEEIEDALSWESISVEDYYISLSDDDVEYKIGKHNLDKESNSDTVVITGTSDEGYLTISFEVEFKFVYSGGWYASSENVTDSSVEYAEGYEIDEISDEDFQTMLADEYESIYVMGYGYDADSDDVTISEVKLDEIEYNDNYSYADISFTVAEGDVEFTVDSEVTLYYDLDEEEWEFYYFNDYEITSFTCGSQGKWTGTNDEDTVIITVEDELYEDDDYLKATVDVTTKDGVKYSYAAYVSEYEPGNLYMAIIGDEWIVEPTDTTVEMYTYYGYYDEDITTYTPDYTYKKFTFTKQQ